MLSLTHQFLAWCRSKPADEEYDPSDKRSCALGQFGAVGTFSWNCEQRGIPRWLYRAAVIWNGERPTFGALADRVERQLAEQVAL